MAIRAPAKTPCTHTSHTPHGYTRTCKNTLHTHTHTHITHTTWLYAHLQKHPAHTHTSYTTWLYTHLQKHPAHTHTHHTPHGYTRTWKCTLNGMQADFTPTTISTVLWAYAACGYYDRVMCNTLGRRAALCFKDMSLFEVTQVRWKQEQLF